MALSLLELVTRAGQAEDAGRVEAESAWSVSLQPLVTTLSGTSKSKAESHGNPVEYMDDLITRETGEWRVGAPSKEEEALVKKLSKKLENVQTFTTTEFVAMVRPALENAARQADATSASPASTEYARENGSVAGDKALTHSSKDRDESDEVLTLKFLRKGGAFLGRRLLASIMLCSLGLRFWPALQVMLECGLVSIISHPELVQKLVDDRQASLLCRCLYHVLDLPPSDILTILKFFLEESNSSRRSFEIVRQEWRRLASAAIDRAARKTDLSTALVPVDSKATPKKQGHERGTSHLKSKINDRGVVATAIALAASVDGFQGWEVCLHGLVASGQDEAVLAAVVAELDTGEAVQLLRYLQKWLDRYSKQLAHMPSPNSKCPGHKVPSLPQVLQWASIVLDGQYTKFLFCSDFLPELRALQGTIQSLVAVGTRFSPLLGVTEHIRSSAPLPASKQGNEAASDYIIEFLDIS